MPNLKLTIAFDGTHFSGWQKQLNAPTIQGELEKVLGRITNNSVILHGAGRTDAGVHALGMVASLETESRITLTDLLRGCPLFNDLQNLYLHRRDRKDSITAYSSLRSSYPTEIINRGNAAMPENCYWYS